MAIVLGIIIIADKIVTAPFLPPNKKLANLANNVLQAGSLSVKLERTAIQSTELNEKGVLVAGDDYKRYITVEYETEGHYSSCFFDQVENIEEMFEMVNVLHYAF